MDEKSPAAQVADDEAKMSPERTSGPESSGELPQRYRPAKFFTVDDVMPDEWIEELAEWLHWHRKEFEVESTEGVRCYFARHRVDFACEILGQLRKQILERIGDAFEPCGVEPFEVFHLDFRATLHHHGGFEYWDHDRDGVVPFEYTLCSDPALFTGGEIEFMDGTVVEPKSNRLTFFNPTQLRRLTSVECWSALAAHGRWAIRGFAAKK